MMCDRCGQRQALIYLTKVVNGQKTELHLCKQCAEKGDSEFFKNLSLINILANLTGGKTRLPQEEPMAVCPNCGFDIERFRREGKVGCEQCYKHFAMVLLPMMRKIHGSLQHTGKHPGSAVARTAVEKKKRGSRLDELKLQLRAAVQAEEYERAAGLRDEIKSIETVEGGACK
jgi:protein arginine kinase activator